MTFDDEDDIPWADPAIRADYEAALGAFLVRFNRFENLVAYIQKKSFRLLGRSDLHRSNESIDARLRCFEVLRLAINGMPCPDFKRARDLVGERNTLAHGHFDQNPYSGEYKIVSQRGRMIDIPVSRLRDLAAEAEGVIDNFTGCEVFLCFYNSPPNEPPKRGIQ